MTDDPADEQLEGLVGRAFVARGELIPTTIDEVLEAATGDVELPASLEGLFDDGAPPAAQKRSAVAERRPPAPAERASSAAGRTEPARALRAVAYVGAAAAAVAMIWASVASRPASESISVDSTHAQSDEPSIAASAKSSAPSFDVSVPACDASCCAGAACSASRSELASCPTGRTCIPCSGLDDPDALYRIRVGDLFAEGANGRGANLDLCIKVGASPSADWSCEPAREPPAARPHGRFLRKATRADDLAGGVAMELRRDGKTVVGRWWSILKPTPKTLCLGYKVGFENDEKEPAGTLSMFLERTYYVELARRETRSDLDGVARAFSFEGIEPRLMTSGARQVLALGPFDRADADETLASIMRRAPGALTTEARIDVGDDYDAW